MKPTRTCAWLVVCLAVLVMVLPGCGKKEEEPQARGADEDSGGTGLVVTDDNESEKEGKGPSAIDPLSAGKDLGTDPFSDLPDVEPANTSKGVLQRFMESWKRGDVELLMRYVRPQDREAALDDPDFGRQLRTRYLDVALVDYEIEAWQWVDFRKRDAARYLVRVVARDKRTEVPRRGVMKVTVRLAGKDRDGEHWDVDLESALPEYE